MKGRKPLSPRKWRNGERLKRDDRRDVDNCATARPHHLWQHGARESHDGIYVQPDGTHFVVEWGRPEVPTRGNARVVYQDVDGAEFGDASCYRSESGCGLKIDGERLDPALLPPHFTRKVFQPVPPSRDGEHAVSKAHKLPRKGTPYTGRGSGHDRPALRFGANTHVAPLSADQSVTVGRDP
jgi:hypothetical protein